jgi:hypothetical protein
VVMDVTAPRSDQYCLVIVRGAGAAKITKLKDYVPLGSSYLRVQIYESSDGSYDIELAQGSETSTARPRTSRCPTRRWWSSATPC